MDTLQLNLKKYRTLKGYTRKDVSTITKISYPLYLKYEAGKQVPSLSKLKIIADALDVHVAQLISSREELYGLQNSKNLYMSKNDKLVDRVSDTHIVIKYEDCLKYLSKAEMNVLEKLKEKISDKREEAGKPRINDYYICNVDEPYSEAVLAVILAGELNKNKTFKGKE